MCLGKLVEEFPTAIILPFHRKIIFTLPNIGFIIQPFYLTSSTLVLLRVSELEKGD